MRVAPAFYYIDVATLLRDYFFSNRMFCANYATKDTEKQEFFARGVQYREVQETNRGEQPEVCRL